MLPTRLSKAARAATVCSGVLALLLAVGFTSSLWAAHHSAIFGLDQPDGAVDRSSQTGEDWEVIRGVNLGGWLVLEPWIVPSLFYQFQGMDAPPVDEKGFCAVLGPDAAKQLKDFRDTWVTEDTFRRLKEIGLNAVRIPYGYWSWGDIPDFCPNISAISYLDKAVEWAGRHNMRVHLDLHGAVGSENSFDNSGDCYRGPGAKKWHESQGMDARWDPKAWLKEPANSITRQAVSRTVARYANQSHVVMFGFLNEISEQVGSTDRAAEYYKQTYSEVLAATDSEFAARASPVLDVSFRPTSWKHVRTEQWLNAGRWGAMLDVHRYFAFLYLGSYYPQVALLRKAACDWHSLIASSHEHQLPMIVGEWSLATSDCMTWLNGFGVGTTGSASSTCSSIPCPETYGTLAADGLLGSNGAPVGECPVDPDKEPLGKLGFDDFYRQLALYQMHAFERSRGWFFWNFQCEVADPRWCFLTAHDRGWFPKNMSVDAYSPPTPHGCNHWDTPFGSLMNAVYVSGVSLVLLLLLGLAACAVAVWRRFKPSSRTSVTADARTPQGLSLQRQGTSEKPHFEGLDPDGQLGTSREVLLT